ncbi:LemA family protein [Exiguobacterium acetylicum]|uniref:LemA family protein n=1 Tax=Exiguobacterium acetylicum TaxID=41170 RepID=UPI001EE3441E|nr:LemA family protein [Exiguobacterium acetylicum]UKS56507.1 LemA family protein [Exiguobacterium acetylicum]
MARRSRSGSKLPLIIGVVVVAVIAFLAIGQYNSLVNVEEDVSNKWSQVDNQIKRRADLIPNLVETVKGVAGQEEKVYGKVAEAQAGLARAASTEQRIEADQQVTSSLRGLIALQTTYPELKSSERFQSLMDTLEGTENRLGIARKDYNDAVTLYNKKRRSFPTTLYASEFGFEKKPYYEISDSDRENPTVDFNSDSK